MASVDGKTSFKIDELINDTIISGEVVDGHLLLESRGGAQIDAGVVTGGGTPGPAGPAGPTGATGPAGAAGASTSALDFMPIGYIYTSVSSTSPSVLFGGSWSRIGQGRVLVGQDGTQTEFDTAEETGGEKNHTITSGELPAHAHAIDHNHAAATSTSDGIHTHNITRKTAAGTSTGVVRGGATATADGSDIATGGHTHTVDLPNHVGASGSTGSGTAGNNLQPYLVVFMWKRTA